MDLIDEMEAMEERALGAAPTAAVSAIKTITPSCDVLLQQTAFVQARLKALWAAKHRVGLDSTCGDDDGVSVPFAWALAKVRALSLFASPPFPTTDWLGGDVASSCGWWRSIRMASRRRSS